MNHRCFLVERLPPTVSSALMNRQEEKITSTEKSKNNLKQGDSKKQVEETSCSSSSCRPINQIN